MAFDLKSITTDPRVLPPRIILLGTPKVGKTTWAAAAPDVVLLPIKGEEGADDMTCAKFPTAQTFDDIVEAIATLATEKHNYKFVTLDSTTAIERLVWEKACADNKWQNIESPGFGKGYVIANTYWKFIIDGLDHLRNERGMGCILIGHVKAKVFNDPQFDPYDTFMWDVKDTAASMMTKWADCILFARPKQFVKSVGAKEKDERNETKHAIGQGERCLYTQERPAHPGGGRGVYGHLPYELPLKFEAWASEVDKLMQKQQPKQ